MPEAIYFQPSSISVRRRKLLEILEHFEGTQTAWSKFIRPGLQIVKRSIWAAVGAKTKKPQMAQTTSNLWKSMSGGEILSLGYMHGHGLRLRVIWIYFKKNFYQKRW